MLVLEAKEKFEAREQQLNNALMAHDPDRFYSVIYPETAQDYTNNAKVFEVDGDTPVQYVMADPIGKDDGGWSKEEFDRFISEQAASGLVTDDLARHL